MKPKLCKKCGREIPSDAVLCPYCAELVKQNDTETESVSESDDIFAEFSNQSESNSSNIGSAGLIIAVTLLIFIFIVMYFNNQDNYKSHYNSSGYSTSTSSSSYSQNSYSTPTPTPNNGKSLDAIMSVAESQGYVCGRSGYTFDACVKAAQNYGLSFNTTAVFYATADMKYYFLNGYTSDGRIFSAEIQHDYPKDNDWTVKSVSYDK